MAMSSSLGSARACRTASFRESTVNRGDFSGCGTTDTSTSVGGVLGGLRVVAATEAAALRVGARRDRAVTVGLVEGLAGCCVRNYAEVSSGSSPPGFGRRVRVA